MPQFRKKPVVIEAVQWDGVACTEVIEFLGEDLLKIKPTRNGRDGHLTIRTLEGPLGASPGDFIIRGVKGEHYACKPEIFEATYDPVAAQQTGDPR
jgi:hypothetical protein